ncbi:Hypothetical_protein [Hexamita inflata]|uniref:Hypothetical_protein n=1 Tax=Hexamita inflata TaxID=28002 RepID=A0ABP1H8L7_9EUKA
MMRPRITRINSIHKLETIHESDNEASETSLNSIQTDNRSARKSNLNIISTVSLDTFISLSRRDLRNPMHSGVFGLLRDRAKQTDRLTRKVAFKEQEVAGN